jgi:hypothetical protein
MEPHGDENGVVTWAPFITEEIFSVILFILSDTFLSTFPLV